MTQRSGCRAAPDWISLIVSPDELDAMITSGGSSSSSWPIELLLEVQPLGPVLLDEVRARQRCRAGRQ